MSAGNRLYAWKYYHQAPEIFSAALAPSDTTQIELPSTKFSRPSCKCTCGAIKCAMRRAAIKLRFYRPHSKTTTFRRANERQRLRRVRRCGLSRSCAHDSRAEPEPVVIERFLPRLQRRKRLRPLIRRRLRQVTNWPRLAAQLEAGAIPLANKRREDQPHRKPPGTDTISSSTEGTGCARL